MTIKEIADRAGLKYHTARNYIKIFESHGVELDEAIIPLLEKVPGLLSEGLTISEAVDVILRTPQDSEGQTFSDILGRLEAKIDRLERENKVQSDLLQVYLSKIDRLEEKILALPAPTPPKTTKLTDKIFSFFRKKPSTSDQ